MKQLGVIALTMLALGSSATLAVKLKPFHDKDIDLWGLKNAKGKIVVKAQYQAILPEDDLIAVFKNNHVYRLDHDGKMKFETVFFDNGPDYYEQGLARFIEKNKVGFHNKKGEIVIKAIYDWGSPFEEGRSFVCDGCWATPEKLPRYRAAASSGAAPMLTDEHLVLTGGKWGAINLKGELILPVESSSREEARKKLAK